MIKQFNWTSKRKSAAHKSDYNLAQKMREGMSEVERNKYTRPYK